MAKTNQKRIGNKGFSLVELIVVIAIMAVLVGVLAPTLIRYVEKGRQSTDIQNADSIATSLKTYYSDKEDLSGPVTVKLHKGSAPTVEGDDNAALTDAGLQDTQLKGDWQTEISIKYDNVTGKITYTAKSKYYSASNVDEIKPD